MIHYCTACLPGLVETTLPPERGNFYLCQECTDVLNEFRLKYALKNVRPIKGKNNARSTGYHIADVKQQKC